MVYLGLPVILTCMIAPHCKQLFKLPRIYTRSFKMSSQTNTPETALSDVVSNAHVVNERIQACAEAAGRPRDSVRLVAVSKTKPAEAIQQLYDAGYRHFGENYLQELTEKAAILPKDIHWHFIGHLQSSKASKITKDVPNLYMLETIDSEKLANKVNNARGTAGLPPLKVFIQVDTSGEATKSGVDTGSELLSLATFITEQCPNLRLAGLMTIGKLKFPVDGRHDSCYFLPHIAILSNADKSLYLMLVLLLSFARVYMNGILCMLF